MTDIQILMKIIKNKECFNRSCCVMREISNNIYQTKYTPCPLNNIYCTKIQGDTYILSNEVTIIGMYPKEGYIQEAERLLAACTPEDIFEELL